MTHLVNKTSPLFIAFTQKIIKYYIVILISSSFLVKYFLDNSLFGKVQGKKRLWSGEDVLVQLEYVHL